MSIHPVRFFVWIWLLTFVGSPSVMAAPDWMRWKEDEVSPGVYESTLTLKLPIVPLTVLVEPKNLNNCSLRSHLPLKIEITTPEPTHILPPYGALDKTKDWKCDYSWKFRYGNESVKDLQNCTLLYPLADPIEPKVIQGFNTQDTHSGRFAYSVDFAAPEGSSVLAAHDGVVAEVQDEDRPQGVEGNFIALLHPSGFLTKYTHLKAHSMRVKPGNRVLAGAPIAETGTSGFREDGKPMAPHLHFDAYVAKEERTTIPFNLKRNGKCLKF